MCRVRAYRLAANLHLLRHNYSISGAADNLLRRLFDPSVFILNHPGRGARAMLLMKCIISAVGGPDLRQISTDLGQR